jgi:hypothetical protein
MYSSFLEDLLPNKTYYVENIKSTNFILGTNTKSMNWRIHELVIFNQTTKIDAHEEKCFHSISYESLSRFIYNFYFHKFCFDLCYLCILSLQLWHIFGGFIIFNTW